MINTTNRNSFRLPVWLLIACFAGTACKSSDAEKAEVAKLAQGCSLNSNCESPLVCAFAHCHEECEADRDCSEKARCVRGDKGHVCQLAEETACVRDKDCKSDKQVCGVDHQCRDECTSDGDCTSGQLCAQSGECASKDPQKDMLDDKGNILSDMSSGSSGSGGNAGKAGGTAGAAGKAGSGGSGGAGAGSGGAGGKAGSGGMSADPCGSEVQANEDRDHPAPFASFGSDVKYCLQSASDIDFYELKTPAQPVQGGFYVVKLTQVGEKGGLEVSAQAAADNGDVQSAAAGSGVSVFLWFNAKAGATFRLRVRWYTGDNAAVPYTLRVDYKGVPDDNEPNDLRAMAKAINVGTAVKGYLFAGYENSTSVADSDWEDWFKVTLPVGDFTVTLADLASDIGARVEVYNAMGTSLKADAGGAGENVVIMFNAETAGDYTIKLEHYTEGSVRGTGSTVPAYLTQPYTITVMPQ